MAKDGVPKKTIRQGGTLKVFLPYASLSLIYSGKFLFSADSPGPE
jgi:hypothetical protein